MDLLGMFHFHLSEFLLELLQFHLRLCVSYAGLYAADTSEPFAIWPHSPGLRHRMKRHQPEPFLRVEWSLQGRFQAL